MVNEAEIEQFDKVLFTTAFRNEDIARLHVAVHESLAMRLRQRPAHLKN